MIRMRAGVLWRRITESGRHEASATREAGRHLVPPLQIERSARERTAALVVVGVMAVAALIAIIIVVSQVRQDIPPPPLW